MALQMGHTVAGLIAPGCKSAEIHAAVSSVAMSGRLVQFVRCWEMAAVVSGDGREVQGTGLSWCRDDCAVYVKYCPLNFHLNTWF